ncbi:hypothetical protein IQ06DRAFT_330528 [Phaeosphaeriaceae sp. SRC1lsM3a]|nr:hypothetical protein IQ06DRAFT_330528 [Stagonospora sp. SRC1lsM3a]
MAPIKLIERSEPTFIPRAHAPARSRLPGFLRVPILVVLSFGIKSMLWSAALNFLAPELGAISKVPSETDMWSLYSPPARLVMNIATMTMNWYLNYDFWDVAALTTLVNAPYAYLLTTYYDISTLTVAAHVNIEVLAIAIPTFLLRSRSVAHRSNVPLRNRFLLESTQVQLTNWILATSVYVTILWTCVNVKFGFLTIFLIKHFDIPTLEAVHAEDPVSIILKVAVAGAAAKEFLLNPSIAAQPQSGTSTPVAQFDPATATLDETIKANVVLKDKRKNTLAQQTLILNALLMTSTVQRCMTLKGAELTGAVGYSGIWVVANTILSLWYAWVGDSSPDYEPL